MSRRTMGLVVAFLLGAGAGRAGEVIHDGVRVRFELVRVPAGPEEPVAEAVGGSAAGIHRVLLDREHGRYFGYTVHVSALGGGRYRVRIGPLAREWREQAGRLHGEMAGDPEAIVEDPKAIRFTAGGDRFDWVSAEPIVTAPARIFVWHDRGHQCRPGEVFGVGTDPAPGDPLPGR